MEETDKCSDGEFWKHKLKKHWKIFVASIIGGAVAIAVSLLVLFWFIDTSTIGVMGAATIRRMDLSVDLGVFHKSHIVGVIVCRTTCRSCLWSRPVFVVEKIASRG